MATVALEGVTATLETGAAVTRMETGAAMPLLRAVTVALPGATPATRPVADTVAMRASELPHVIVAPATGTPSASVTLAASCRVLPCTSVALVDSRPAHCRGWGPP